MFSISTLWLCSYCSHAVPCFFTTCAISSTRAEYQPVGGCASALGASQYTSTSAPAKAGVQLRAVSAVPVR